MFAVTGALVNYNKNSELREFEGGPSNLFLQYLKHVVEHFHVKDEGAEAATAQKKKSNAKTNCCPTYFDSQTYDPVACATLHFFMRRFRVRLFIKQETVRIQALAESSSIISTAQQRGSILG